LLCYCPGVRGQETGVVRGDLDAASAAYALVAQIEGILSLARNSQDPADLAVGARGLRSHLQSMRPGRVTVT
jgi:hypothetical protein